jgi:hypothetical protein
MIEVHHEVGVVNAAVSTGSIFSFTNDIPKLLLSALRLLDVIGLIVLIVPPSIAALATHTI